MDGTSASRYRATELAMWRAHGAEPMERWVDVRAHGIRVRVLEVGSGSPLMFVHGAPTAGSIWASLVARIAGFRCLVLDRPGCGLSEPLRSERAASPSALVDVQVAVLDAAGVERADVVGSSFGGASALWLAERFPGRVDRIVLEGTPAIAGITPTVFNRLLAARPLGQLLARLPSSRRIVQESFRIVGERRLVESGWPRGSDADWALSLNNDTDTLRNETALLQHVGTWRSFRGLRLFDPIALRRIGQPTLWLWGVDDPYASVGQGRAWAASMPVGSFELRSNAGHLPWLDDPEGHARRIEGFLSEPVRPVDAHDSTAVGG